MNEHLWYEMQSKNSSYFSIFDWKIDIHSQIQKNTHIKHGVACGIDHLFSLSFYLPMCLQCLKKHCVGILAVICRGDKGSSEVDQATNCHNLGRCESGIIVKL